MEGIDLGRVLREGFLGGSDVKNPPAMQETWFDLWVGKISWRREWLPTPVFLPGEFHGQGSLVGFGPWGRTESDTTEQLMHFHISISILNCRLSFICHNIFIGTQLLTHLHTLIYPNFR